MTKHESLRRAHWSCLLALVVATGLGCKEPNKYQEPAVDRTDGGGQKDARGGAGGSSGSLGTGGNGAPAWPGLPDAGDPPPDVPATLDAPGDTEPSPTCVPNVPCSQGIGPCRQGATTCATPTGEPACADVGADDTKGGCAGTNVCLGGACVPPCASSVPCTDGIKPCRKGATTCATATSQAGCADVGADDSRGGCPGGNVCSNGSCVAPCKANVPCTQGLGPCRKGLTACASPTAQAVCMDAGADDTRGGCGGGNVCSNGSCVAPCKANVPCSQGLGPCRKGLTACASPTAQPTCVDAGPDDSRGGCSSSQECRGGMCAQKCQGGGDCSVGIAPCRKGIWVCSSSGQRTCQDAGVDTGANGEQQRCSSGNVCKNGGCELPCGPGVGPAAGCPSGFFCDTSTTPRKCVRQVRPGQPCQTCEGNCHQGNKSGVKNECENGYCTAGGVNSSHDFCCHNDADICDPPGRGCCSWYPAASGPVDQCDLTGEGCASLSCDTSTGRCR